MKTYRWPILVSLILFTAMISWYMLRPLQRSIPLVNARDGVVQRLLDRARAEIQESPDSIRSWAHYGRLLRAHGFDAEATDCFLTLMDMEPTNGEWPYLAAMGIVLTQPERGMELVVLAEQRAHDQPDAEWCVRLRLAELLMISGDAASARRLLNQAATQRPNSARIQFALAMLAMDHEDWTSAARLLREFVDDPFVRKKVATHLATIALRMNNDEERLRMEQRAQSLPPDLPWPDPYLSQCLALETGRQRQWAEIESLEAAGKLAEANRLLVEQLRYQPDARSFLAMGINLAKMGQWDVAEDALRNSLKIDSNQPQAYAFLSMVLFQRGEQLESKQSGSGRANWLDAIVQADAAIERKADLATAYLYRGHALRRLQKYPEAIRALQSAIDCRPEQAELYLGLGQTYLDAGQADKANQAFNSAIELAGASSPITESARRLITMIP